MLKVRQKSVPMKPKHRQLCRFAKFLMSQTYIKSRSLDHRCGVDLPFHRRNETENRWTRRQRSTRMSTWWKSWGSIATYRSASPQRWPQVTSSRLQRGKIICPPSCHVRWPLKINRMSLRRRKHPRQPRQICFHHTNSVEVLKHRGSRAWSASRSSKSPVRHRMDLFAGSTTSRLSTPTSSYRRDTQIWHQHVQSQEVVTKFLEKKYLAKRRAASNYLVMTNKAVVLRP